MRQNNTSKKELTRRRACQSTGRRCPFGSAARLCVRESTRKTMYCLSCMYRCFLQDPLCPTQPRSKLAERGREKRKNEHQDILHQPTTREGPTPGVATRATPAGKAGTGEQKGRANGKTRQMPQEDFINWAVLVDGYVCFDDV
jgi:hypothetical protein